MNNKELIQTMEELGYLNYGSSFSGDSFRALCGIDKVESGTYEDFKKMELEVLTRVGYIRDYLLNKGKYLKQERDSYRVLLPSENIEQVRSYMRSADRKLKRGIKLDKNTPVEQKKQGDNEMVRMIMKRESIKDHLGGAE